ncbi:uncharacterized protein DS421_11g331790 [Arachis hypogaea]|nr:uncharacterized protein DS421_11g331790 [Arachis hypogaea]
MEHVMTNVRLFAVYLNCAGRFVGLPARTCFDFHLLNRILMGKKKLVEMRCSPCYINGMITHLQEMNANAKLAEIDSIGFGFVKQIPRWAVKQTIMIQLARAYDVETVTLIVDVGDIPVSSELIGRALGIPSNGKAIETHQNKKLETCGGCMFALMRLRHGPLDRCQEPEPWLTAWTASELEKKANNVIDEGPIGKRAKFREDPKLQTRKKGGEYAAKKRAERENAGVKRLKRNAKRHLLKIWTIRNQLKHHQGHVNQNFLEALQNPTEPLGESKIGTRRKLLIVRPKFGKGNHTARATETHKKRSAVISDSDDDDHVPHVIPKRRLFDHRSSLTESPEVEEILVKIEQKKYSNPLEMEPLQTVMPNKSQCQTPREEKEDTVRDWILSSSLNEDELLATYEGRPYLRLLRKDLLTLKAWGWVNSNIIQWMCYTFNDAQSERFKRDFYCETVMQPHNLKSFHNGPVAVYEGLGPNFGEDSRFFNKVDAAKTKWWFISMCSKGHWWLYAFEVARKRIMGRLIEDMARVAIPTYDRSPNGPVCAYAKVPMQPNGWDCGIYAIKFMETWNEDCNIDEWNNEMLLSMRFELMLDIVMGAHNESIQLVQSLLEQKDGRVRRNRQRNTKKEVKSPFTAPSTRSLMERVGELPVRKTRKRRMR